MPGGEKLRKAKLRGVASEGMILSVSELEVGGDADGIIVLEDEPAPGTPLAEVLPLAEPVLELEVTPNRSDCFGIWGVAREVHAISAAPLAAEPWSEDAPAEGGGDVNDFASVTVEVPELCPRFTARVFTDVTIGPSPLWLQARLTAAGQRPINNVVDITNYVMLLTAQPLHAFDLDKVPGGALTVRAAGDGEKMTTLDDVERTLDAETVLVCDENGPTGIAGIMGGQVSEVSAATTRVLLEVANWNGTNILRTSRQLGLRSEASSRFEKQLHPDLCLRAQRIASRLLVELCGAKLVPGTIDVAAEIPAAPQIELRAARVEGLLGMRIEQADQVAYLERLGFGVEVDGDDLAGHGPARAPLRRHPRGRPDRGGRPGPRLRASTCRRRCRRWPRRSAASAASSSCGGGPRTRCATSASTRSSAGASPTPARTAGCGSPPSDPRAEAVLLANPLSEDQSAMRTTLLGSLLDVASRNLARDADAVALFESGQVYLNSPPTGRNVEPEATNRPIDPLAGSFVGERGGAVCGAASVRRRWRSGRWSRSPGAAAASRPTSSRSRACWRRWPGSSGSSSSFAAAEEPFLHPGRVGRGRDRRRRGRLDRRGPPAGLPRVGPRGRGRLRNRGRRR